MSRRLLRHGQRMPIHGRRSARSGASEPALRIRRVNPCRVLRRRWHHTEVTRTAKPAAVPGLTLGGVLGLVLGVVTAALVAGGFVLGPHVGNLHNGLIAASFTAVGLYVVHRRPGN